MITPQPLTMHPAAVYLDGLSKGSRATMEPALNAIAKLITDGQCDALTLDWAALRYQHTAAIRTTLMKKFAPATVNKMLSALRRVLHEAFKLDLIDANDYAKAVDFKSIKVEKGLKGRALTQAEITKLLQVCQEQRGAVGARDAALIGILRGAGLRRAEVVNLTLKDFHPLTGELEICNGKGGKDRSVYLPKIAIDLVNNWLTKRGHRAGALLCPIQKGGQVELRHLTPQAVLLIVRKLANDAGITRFSPHDFRRTFCSDLLDAGVDIVTVQKLAGHSNPAITSKYDRRGEQVKRKAVDLLKF
ncbi:MULTISPECIES: tyrosine-type recombinase/integrase [Aerosakkonema]|uniref:tyrosine-type recombinase/integrase n=1 Tax=Aerosakkonema TaxID=1246629 RepID=UPI0035B9119F